MSNAEAEQYLPKYCAEDGKTPYCASNISPKVSDTSDPTQPQSNKRPDDRQGCLDSEISDSEVEGGMAYMLQHRTEGGTAYMAGHTAEVWLRESGRVSPEIMVKCAPKNGSGILEGCREEEEGREEISL